VKAVDHGDGAERGIEIKDGGAPLAIDDVPVDLDAFDRGEESREDRAHRGFSLKVRANRSYELYVWVKWRSTYIPCSKAVQVRFNGTDHVFPHENSISSCCRKNQVRKGGGAGPILHDPFVCVIVGDKSLDCTHHSVKACKDLVTTVAESRAQPHARIMQLSPRKIVPFEDAKGQDTWVTAIKVYVVVLVHKFAPYAK